jgi:hypothetical protein
MSFRCDIINITETLGCLFPYKPVKEMAKLWGLNHILYMSIMAKRKEGSNKHINAGVKKLEALPGAAKSITIEGEAIAEATTAAADETSRADTILEAIASMEEAAEGLTDARLEAALAASPTIDDKTADSLAALAEL